ncbi:phosphatases II [Nemania abortiva]|nr:phosphatases II [Nemania abortiva]
MDPVRSYPPYLGAAIAQPTSPYTRKPPSPPHITIPVTTLWEKPMKIVPRYDNIDPASLSDKDLSIITQNHVVQVAHDPPGGWTYASRREAQSVLDYLYLGPSTVVRNRQWLQEQGITMIVGARDARQANLNMMTFDKVVQDLGIEARYIDISGYYELNSVFPSAVHMINDHMLRIYHDQAVGKPIVDAENEGMVIDQASFRRGRILVFCETGNDRSAVIVCAYLMAVLGMTAFQAIQFTSFQRFCVSMDENFKRALLAYEDILLAQRTVHQHELRSDLVAMPKKAKRGIEEIIDADGDDNMTGMDRAQSSDRERFIGRAEFQPFVDS